MHVLVGILIMNRLVETLKKYKKFAIAFSGGVDSTFLAALAKTVCDSEVVAITGNSAFQSQQELKKAAEMAAIIGIEHIVVRVDVMSIPAITLNSKDRCYFCKKKLFGDLQNRAKELGFDTLVHGVNMDDLKDFRPGLKAAEEMSVLSPLVEAEMTKNKIRFASKKMGLKTWNMPSQSCLATRIPYNEPITYEKLTNIEACEDFLHQLGFYGVRVRCHSYIVDTDIPSINKTYLARIECNPKDISLIVKDDIRDKISLFFTKHGFRFVSLDLEGYSLGNMN